MVNRNRDFGLSNGAAKSFGGREPRIISDHEYASSIIDALTSLILKGENQGYERDTKAQE